MRAIIGIFLTAFLWGASAATTYKWLDDEGKTHYSETVPDQYLKQAKPIMPAATAPSAEAQRQAIERAAQDKARAAALDLQARTPPAATSSPSAASAPKLKRPTQLPDETTDCETWARLYRESLDCFGPYRTTRGATKPEAFDACNVVSEPPIRCRPQIP